MRTCFIVEERFSIPKDTEEISIFFVILVTWEPEEFMIQGCFYPYFCKTSIWI